MVITINSNDGTIDVGSFQQAQLNIKKFIDDCEVNLVIQEAYPKPIENGLYQFILLVLDTHIEVEVLIPGISLEKVRFMGCPHQNIFDFPQLYVNGVCGVWNSSLIRKVSILNTLEHDKKNIQKAIEAKEHVIEKMKDKLQRIDKMIEKINNTKKEK